jgi:hypothetical protein
MFNGPPFMGLSDMRVVHKTLLPHKLVSLREQLFVTNVHETTGVFAFQQTYRIYAEMHIHTPANTMVLINAI